MDIKFIKSKNHINVTISKTEFKNLVTGMLKTRQAIADTVNAGEFTDDQKIPFTQLTDDFNYFIEYFSNASNSSIAKTLIGKRLKFIFDKDEYRKFDRVIKSINRIVYNVNDDDKPTEQVSK